MTSRQRSAGTIALTAGTNDEFVQVRIAIVAVALANKFARIAWRLMVSGGVYNRPLVAGNYSPPHRWEKFNLIRHMAERRDFCSDGGSEPVRSVFGLRSVTF